jgi:hypothetical protein
VLAEWIIDTAEWIIDTVEWIIDTTSERDDTAAPVAARNCFETVSCSASSDHEDEATPTYEKGHKGIRLLARHTR